MKQRCLNPKAHAYENYGGRGIAVCERWIESFENFLADMGERPSGKTLDRKNNDGHYEPGNCRWATPKEQIANSRKPLPEVKARMLAARHAGLRRKIANGTFVSGNLGSKRSEETKHRMRMAHRGCWFDIAA